MLMRMINQERFYLGIDTEREKGVYIDDATIVTSHARPKKMW